MIIKILINILFVLMDFQNLQITCFITPQEFYHLSNLLLIPSPIPSSFSSLSSKENLLKFIKKTKMIISRFPKRVPIAVSSTYELLKTHLKLEALQKQAEEKHSKVADEQEFGKMNVENNTMKEGVDHWRRDNEETRKEEDEGRTDEEERSRRNEENESREEEIYREALLQILRITSQLSDIYQINRNFSLNKVLETIGMVEHEFISEIRHMATHKHLPSKILVRKSVDYLLKFFIDKFWRKREEGGLKEEEIWGKEEIGGKEWEQKRAEIAGKNEKILMEERKKREKEVGEVGRELFKIKSLSGFKRKVGIILTNCFTEDLLRLPSAFAINSKISKFKGAIFLSKLIQLILNSGKGEGSRKIEEEEREERRKKKEEEKKEEKTRREVKKRTGEGERREESKRKEEHVEKRENWLKILEGCILLTKNKKIMRKMFCYPFLKYRTLQMIFLDWLDPLYNEIMNVLLSANCFEKDELYRLKKLRKKIQEGEVSFDAEKKGFNDVERNLEDNSRKSNDESRKNEDLMNIECNEGDQRILEEFDKKKKVKGIFYGNEEIKKWLNERAVMTEEVQVQGSHLFNYFFKNNILK